MREKCAREKGGGASVRARARPHPTRILRADAVAPRGRAERAVERRAVDGVAPRRRGRARGSARGARRRRRSGRPRVQRRINRQDLLVRNAIRRVERAVEGRAVADGCPEAKPVYCLVDGVGGERVGPRAPRRRLSRRGVARRRVSRTNSGAESRESWRLVYCSAPANSFSNCRK